MVGGTGMTGGIPLPGNRWDLLDGVRPDPLPRVSVIVAHYDQQRELTRTLAALRAQTYPAHLLEIVVADDGSPAPPAVGDGVVLARHADEGFRLAAVRNLGVAHATGDVLVFLDADTAPEPEFVAELTRLPALAPDCVTVGRRRHADLAAAPADGPLAAAVAGRELAEPAWLGDVYRATHDLLDADDRSYRFLIGAVLCCTRTLFDAAGGFDESFDAYGGEDWEWVYRAWLAGAVLAHVPTAVAWHDGPDAGERAGVDDAARNAEAVRLADLIPVPGSRPRGRRPAKADVAVTGPPPASTTAGGAFVSRDSILAVLPGAEDGGDDARGWAADGRFDRVRVHVEILVPVRATGPSVGDAVTLLVERGLGSVELTGPDGSPLVRVTATRARARAARWGRDDLFATASVPASDLEPITGPVDVAAYLGGWG